MADEMAAAREAWLAERCAEFHDDEPCPDPALTDAAGWTAAMEQVGLLQDRAARAAGKDWDYEDDPYE